MRFIRLESMQCDAEIIDLPYEWGEKFALNLDFRLQGEKRVAGH